MSSPNEPTVPQPGETPPPAPQPQPQPQQSPYSAPQGYGPQAGQPYAPQQYGTQPMAPVAPRQPSGFGSLFDMGFRSYATPLIAKFLYMIVMILAILSVIGGIISGIGLMIGGTAASSYASDGGPAILSILGGLLIIAFSVFGAILLLATYRLILEFFVTQFSAAGYIRKMASKQDD